MKFLSWFAILPVVAVVSLAALSQTLAPQPGHNHKLGEVIKLPAPKLKGRMSLEETLAKRRSVREFSEEPLTLEQISQLFWACQGVTDKARVLRTAPSAGALYPLEVYAVTREGVLHYLPKSHEAKVTAVGDVRKDLASAAFGQSAVSDAPCVFVITAVYERTSAKYGARAERYVKMEAGHACQNLLLQAVALGLGAVPMGAFNDSSVSHALSLPKNCAPLYLIPIGHVL